MLPFAAHNEESPSHVHEGAWRLPIRWRGDELDFTGFTYQSHLRREPCARFVSGRPEW